MSLPALKPFKAVATEETIARMLAEGRLVVISHEQALAEGKTLGLTEEDKRAFADRLSDERQDLLKLSIRRTSGSNSRTGSAEYLCHLQAPVSNSDGQ